MRYAVIAMASMLLSTAALSWHRSSTTTAAENTDHQRGSNPKNVTPAPSDSKRMIERVKTAYGKLPISFEANRGQTDSTVKFISRGSGSTLFLTSNGAVLAVKSASDGAVDRGTRSASKPRAGAMRMSMVGANPAPEITGLDRLSGNSNYFRGSDPGKWQSNIPTYARVEYRELYPGVNLVYYGNEQQLEYDFEVAPGGNPSDIRMAFEGVKKVAISADGDLTLRTAGRDIRMHKPSIYQETNGARQTIAGRYVVKGRRQIAFEVGAYDKGKALVIDPVLTYSTFLGGSSYEISRSIALDSAGNAYVTGQTNSFNFPVTINGYDTTYANYADVFVTKMNADGTQMVYSTYLGGNSDDRSLGIAVDSSGNAYVTGGTSSTDYPTTPGAFQTGMPGQQYYGDAFVTKLNSDGTALIYSTFLGGMNSDQANAIAVDSSGNAYVAGSSYSSNFPTTPGAFQTSLSTTYNEDAFVTKLNDSGTALVYSTFLGGAGEDGANAIKVDSSGYAYVTGMTASADFDVTAGSFQTIYGGSSGNYNPYGDAFATKLNQTGTSLVYSTYLGGNGDDTGYGLALADSGEIYLTGSSTSVNFPTTPGVVRVGNGGMTKSANGADSWFSDNSGMTSSSVFALAIDPSNPNVVFAGSNGGGVFKSINGGASWAAINSGLTDLTIKALTIDAAATSTIYLGTYTRGIFRSTNGGTTWRAINTGQNGTTVNAIRIDPANSSIIYAGTNSGMFKTTNGGASWAAANTGLNQGVNVTALAIDPITASTLYAGLSSYGSGVMKSTNAGANWSLSLLSGYITALAIDPSAPSTVYAATDGGIAKSTNGGAAWSGANTGLANRSVNAIVLSPDNSATVYAGSANGVFKSTDGGALWHPGNIGLSGAVVNTLAIDPATPLTLYCGSNSGGQDAFVTKLNAAGTSLGYSTFLGGSASDQGYSIAIDASGNAYVTGTTGSQNFPTVRGGYELFGGYGNDAFATKLNPAGAALIYSTLLGGTDYDNGYGIAVDTTGSAYVTGSTQSQNFPTTDGAFQRVKNSYDADSFVTKIAVLPSLTAELGVAMTTQNGSYVAGSSFTYDVTVTNNGPELATSVTLTDELPDSLVFTGCNSQSGGSCSHAGNSASFVISSLDVGASATVQLYAYVSCSIGDNTMISNTVTVDSSATDSNPSNNSATATISATNFGTTISPTSQLYPQNGGSGTVFVNSGQNCLWSAVSNVGWATITNSSNCCSGYVNYTVASNPDGPRSGTMTIAGQTFTVSQAGCFFPLARDHQSFAGNGGTDTVNVTATFGSCAWTASTTSTFIHITSGSSGTGNGVVQYSVDANPGTINRSDTITIAGQTFTVYQGINFLDVPSNSPFYGDIGKLSARGITLGCGNSNYCPGDPITREQMAAFILRAKGEFNPPTPASQRFNDVPPGNQFYNYIDRLAVLQITLGCTPDHLMYCPADPVKRDQMAAFILRGLSEFNPPTPVSQRFSDVPPGNQFYNFIDRMAVLSITLGCTPDHLMYCPNDSVTRGQMAAFLVRAFGL